MPNVFKCLLTIALALGSATAGAVTNLQFWHSMSGEKGRLVQELVDGFNKENQGKIAVQVQFIGTYEEGLNKVRTALLANRGPHVVQITDIGTQVMIDSGSIVPLQDLAAGDPAFPMKELLPQLRHYYEIDGKLCSLPFASSNPIIYYNVDAFAKAGLKRPPATFTEMAEYSKILTDKNAKVTGITWPLHSWFYEQFLSVQGKSLVNNENGRKGRATEALYSSPESLEFVNLWAKMVKDGSFANVGRGWEPAEQNFLAGRSAMLVTSTSDVFEVGKKAHFKMMTAPLPKRNANTPGGTIIGGNSLWILKGKPAEEQKAAYELVKYMASKPVQRKWHTATGYFPIRADVIAELETEGFYTKNPAARTAIDQLRASPDIAATHGALIGPFSEARVHIESAIEKVLAGQAETKVALAKAKSLTDEALARYNKGRDGANASSKN